MGDSCHSDHLPVIQQVDLQANQRQEGARYKMNTKYLADAAVVTQLRQEWLKYLVHLHFFSKMKRLTNWYKLFCRQKARDRRATEIQLRRDLELVQHQLHRDPTCPHLQATLIGIQEALRNIEKWKAEGQQVRSRVRWRSKGNSGTKEFFQAIQPQRPQALITELLDSTGVSCQDQTQLENICWDFYSNLYSQRMMNQESILAQEQVLAGIQPRLSQAMTEILKAPIQLQELTQALQDMASHKAPGHDGVITEFYKALWPIIGKEFLDMIQAALVNGRLPKGMNDGVISLIPKEGNRNSLNHWRPISLLNVPYKIWAKAMQLRVQPVLMEIICPDQTAFLPMRFILDTIFLTHETLTVAKRTNQPLLLLKMDFSKAYDRVDLRFLYAALVKFGFPAEFMSMVKLLFHQAEACVSINGRITKKFQHAQGVRQGCPLAPYLFLIVGEVLNLTLKKEVADGRIRGIRLPGVQEE
jgi:uncharacterized coiled-coil protein SlyX